MSLTAAACLATDAPKVGDKAPLVTAKDQDGKEMKLADVVGKKVVLLYFYPKDNTPGCTKEACGLRDRMSSLKKDNVEVIGVSLDNEASHKKFIADQSLNMARRVSFLIGLDGKIAHVTDNPSADVHLSEMKDAIAAIAKK